MSSPNAEVEEQTQWPDLQDLRHQVLWIPEEIDGKWGNKGSGRVMTQAVGRGEGRSTR